jgi:hypothetical protein
VRVFSTSWKAATTGRLALAILAMGVAVPAVALALAHRLGLEVPHPLAIVAGAGLALGAMVLVHDRMGARVVSRLEKPVRRRCAESGGEPDDPAARFVALSPGDRARVYEGFHDWDLGLLTLEPERLRYRGEGARLDLPRAAVRAIELGAVTPGWIRAPRVVVRWLGPSGEEAVALRAAGCRTVGSIASASRALAARLEVWRGAGPASAPPGPAGIGPVTGRSPAEAAAPRDLPVLVVLLAILSAAATFVVGFDFGRGIDVFASAFAGVMALRWPAMTSRRAIERKPGTREPERRAA